VTTVRVAALDEIGALAQIHACAFAEPWNAQALAELLATPGTGALVANDEEASVGFVLVRTIAGEAEILTLAVRPASQRRGVGAELMRAAAAAAAAEGATTLWLEVAADNAAALALYRSAGFDAAGRRRGYYRREGGETQDALIFRRVLNSPAASAYAAPP
jgi:[ribosomal protein S18]-alanine N-acetyltransferase